MVYISRSQSNFEPGSNPQNSLEGPTEGKKDPNGAKLKIKIEGCTSKTKAPKGVKSKLIR